MRGTSVTTTAKEVGPFAPANGPCVDPYAAHEAAGHAVLCRIISFEGPDCPLSDAAPAVLAAA